MSANNANPILRRLGIKGDISGGHFSGGRSGKPGDDEEFHNSDIARLLVKIAIKEEKQRRELDFCDSARHAYVYKPCGTCITAMLMPVLYLGRVPKRQRARIRASRSWNLLSSPVVVPHNPFSSKNDSQ